MSAIDARRIRIAKGGGPAPGAYVLYWMQAAVRAEHNLALEHAVHLANELGCPLLVWACIVPDYPGATARHHHFFQEGLADATEAHSRRKIPVVVGRGIPVAQIGGVLEDARVLVTDDKPLSHQGEWVDHLCKLASCPVHVVETNVIVPVETALGKEAYSAASLRPHVMSLVSEFVHPVPERALKNPSPGLGTSYGVAGIDVQPLTPGTAQGGHRQALATLGAFVSTYLPTYDTPPGPNAHPV